MAARLSNVYGTPPDWLLAVLLTYKNPELRWEFKKSILAVYSTYRKDLRALGDLAIDYLQSLQHLQAAREAAKTEG